MGSFSVGEKSEERRQDERKGSTGSRTYNQGKDDATKREKEEEGRGRQ